MTEKKIEDLSYEEAFAELEKTVEMLEAEGRTLDESLALFARGQSLSKYCMALLENAELKVRQISGGETFDG